MKNRWIGGLALATALMLAACTPPPQGADESAGPTRAAASSAPAEATQSAEVSEAAEPTPDDDEY